MLTIADVSGRVIRTLVDPARTPDRSAPRDERDLIIAATNGRMADMVKSGAPVRWSYDQGAWMQSFWI